MTESYLWVAGHTVACRIKPLGVGQAKFTATCRAIKLCKSGSDIEKLEEWRCYATALEINEFIALGKTMTLRFNGEHEYVTLD